MKRIAFMHIPKTGGVSIINAFAKRFGDEDCFTFADHRGITDDSFHGRNFVSAHVYLQDIKTEAYTFTFIREPIAQIASHLLWVDHLGAPEQAAQFPLLPPSIQEAVASMQRTDLSSAVSIDRFLSSLPLDGEQRIVNVQSEMLAFRRNDVRILDSAELAALAIASLNKLDFIGITEKINAEAARLSERLGLSPPLGVIEHLNRSPSRANIDINEASIRRVLNKYIEADARLYVYLQGRSFTSV